MPVLRPSWFYAFLAVCLTYILIGGVVVGFAGTPSARQAAENAEWIASGKYWLDRQACRWLGLCGMMHLNSKGWTWQRSIDDVNPPAQNETDFWNSGSEDPESWSDDERQRRMIPQYVFDHAPYVHLFSGEQYWPGDLAEHLLHSTPRLNYTTILEMVDDRSLNNLDEMNDIDMGLHGRYVYLQSNENVEEKPAWLGGSVNIPASPKKVLGEPDDWPNLDDQDVFRQQRVLQDHEDGRDAFYDNPDIENDRIPSENGRCGGNSGFTCKGSGFGRCCSMYGWCGDSDEFCQMSCDPLAGDCFDPLHPPLRTKTDLRRHARDFENRPAKPDLAGRSTAPAFLVTVDKGNGVLDAFWFFFYSYNLGQKVFNIRFGNHVGDWEHTMIRFKDGKPESIMLSEHDFGDAFTWRAVEKYIPNPDGSETMLGSFSNATVARIAKRPVIFSAVGSHAMYATPGLHPYILPWGLLHDQTDRGPLWDPSLNLRSYTFDLSSRVVRSSVHNPKAPTGWFNYAGHWGDKYYPLSDPRQYRFAGEYHYVNGPTGPRFKNLGRIDVCQTPGKCKIRDWLGGRNPRAMPPDEGPQEEGGLPGGNYTDAAQ